MVDALSFNVTAAHITQTPNVAGGKPCIAGRRIRVQDIYVWHELGGQSAEEIASQYHLTLAQVYAALTYYFDHIDEIQADIRASDRTVQEMMQRYPSKIYTSSNAE